MYDQDFDNSAPYDNMEFPIRKPGTGTWPGPGGSSGTTGAGIKLYGHQTTGRSLGGSKLAPLVEVEGSEGGENNRMQTISFVSAPTTPTTTAAQQLQQQYQGQSNQMTVSVTPQSKITQQSQIKADSASTTSVSIANVCLSVCLHVDIYLSV